MNKTFKYILSCLSIIAAIAPLSSRADNVVPFKLPPQHIRTTSEIANELVESAYESVRLHSPFAIDENTASDNETLEIVDKISEYAAKFLGTRYRLGASGPKQFDCSGFVGYIFSQFGFSLNRSSRSQYTQGESVDKKEIRPGDLLFFSSRSSGKGRVGHVAMVVDVKEDGSCTFIHASTKRGVVYQKFPDNGYYSRNFIGAKRIVGTKHFPAA